MTNAVLGVRLLAPAEWEVLREIRLQALLDSPHAFTSHYQRERQWNERQWRQRFDAGTWVVAVERGAVIGVAGLLGGPPHEPPHLESIWVAPTHRNRGVSRRLLDVVVDVARRTGTDALLLWVLEDNTAARQVYDRLGFEWTGERQPVGTDRGRAECRLCLQI